MRSTPSSIAALALLVLSLCGWLVADAHGIAGKDAEFVAKNSGAQVFPFLVSRRQAHGYGLRPSAVHPRRHFLLVPAEPRRPVRHVIQPRSQHHAARRGARRAARERLSGGCDHRLLGGVQGARQPWGVQDAVRRGAQCENCRAGVRPGAWLRTCHQAAGSQPLERGTRRRTWCRSTWAWRSGSSSRSP